MGKSTMSLHFYIRKMYLQMFPSLGVSEAGKDFGFVNPLSRCFFYGSGRYREDADVENAFSGQSRTGVGFDSHEC